MLLHTALGRARSITEPRPASIFKWSAFLGVVLEWNWSLIARKPAVSAGLSAPYHVCTHFFQVPACSPLSPHTQTYQHMFLMSSWIKTPEHARQWMIVYKSWCSKWYRWWKESPWFSTFCFCFHGWSLKQTSLLRTLGKWQVACLATGGNKFYKGCIAQ